MTRDEQIDALIYERSQARIHREYALADRLREQLQALGVRVEDNKPGSIYTRPSSATINVLQVGG